MALVLEADHFRNGSGAAVAATIVHRPVPADSGHGRRVLRCSAQGQNLTFA
ncbi:hypothetical protein JQ604_20330 [Bradyrhizobium jicamae]|uniref:hypothetical protein n=1 Tax=Bradyrhizobium jicamae TaxID=280332 RepID=UPI001BADD273|nr:hypothetical protein [Bradyrhizobium jicamae]MBR0754539.1 hypothetical protein [Bradyrhizobium jicamae]